MATGIQNHRIKGDYYQKRFVRFDGPDTWVDTTIRATPYKWSDLVRVRKGDKV
jgi:hypothetical protein